MIVQMRPLFSEGYVLRQEMLAALSDQAFSLGELMVTGFGDGFLTGCRLSATREIIQMRPGAILFGGKLCLLTESLSVAYFPTDTLCICKLRFSEEYQSNTCVYREADMVLTGSEAQNSNELEVCRFKLQPGAQLRYKYDDFEDRSTECDTLNTICAPFSAHIGNSMDPELLRVYARELLEANPPDSLRIMNTGHLVRGGIAFGDAYFDELGFFGSAVETAYGLESGYADVPIVALEPELGKDVAAWEKAQPQPDMFQLMMISQPKLIEFIDGKHFMNPFYVLEIAPTLNLENSSINLDEVKQRLGEVIARDKAKYKSVKDVPKPERKKASIYEKLDWFDGYLQTKHNRLNPDVVQGSFMQVYTDD